MTRPLLGLSTLLLALPALGAGESTYRVVGIEPSKKGAKLEISYFNTPGTCGGNNAPAAGATIKASLFLYPSNPRNGNFGGDYKTGSQCKPGGICAGKFEDWKGTGTTKVELDYAKLGLKPGQQIWTGVNFFWDKWGHNWGDTVAGREAGGPHVLPEPAAAKKNALFRRTWGPGFTRAGPRRWPGGPPGHPRAGRSGRWGRGLRAR